MDFFENIRHGFRENKKEGVVFYTIPAFDDTGLVRHGFSSRIGGVSTGPFESLCFSLSREKNPDNFRANIRIFAGAAGVDYDKLTAVNYAHGDGIYSLVPADNGKGVSRANDIPKCDALVCDNPDVAAITMHADCVPLFYLDSKTGVSCIAHSGWRGVVKCLPAKIVDYLTEKYGIDPADLLVGVGPHIMKCCFEVGEDVKNEFSDNFGPEAYEERNGRFYADMQYSILTQLRDRNIAGKNITVADMCTSCRPDLFYSHRRDRGNTGAMASLMQKE